MWVEENKMKFTKIQIIILVALCLCCFCVCGVLLMSVDSTEISHTPTVIQKVATVAIDTPVPTSTKIFCDSAYPTVCIAPFPPDLNCEDVPYKNFVVLQPDPHNFDKDKNGIGCEE